MAYVVMAYVLTAYVVMAYTVLAYVVIAYTVMAYIVMAYIVMAYIVMARSGVGERLHRGGSGVDAPLEGGNGRTKHRRLGQRDLDGGEK